MTLAVRLSMTNEFAGKPVCYTTGGGSTFNITLWASDGTTKQTETVPVVIKASCVRRY